jgi:hypothetical protein
MLTMQALQDTTLSQPEMVLDVVKGAARQAGSPRPFPGLYTSLMIDQPFIGAS